MKLNFTKQTNSMLRMAIMAVLVAVTQMAAFAQQTAEKSLHVYGVGFYNLENMFDTIHDEGKLDEEYLPDGKNGWGTLKYESKLQNMSRVLSDLATQMTMKSGLMTVCKSPAIIGLAEVENRNVLTDLLNQPALRDKGWEIIHEEGPDRRGIDCAFLYNPAIFHLQSHHLKPYVAEDGTDWSSRGFLIASGTLAGENISFIVNHWPSRGNVEQYRRWAGHQLRQMIDSLFEANPDEKVVIMGDLNDDPKNRSITDDLGAKHTAADCGPHDMYNPWWDTLYKGGQGTLLYDGKWNLFDQIMVSGNMLSTDGNKDNSSLRFRKNEIYLRNYLFADEGKTKGAPKRTFASGVWLNGYSDHLPTQIFLIKATETRSKQ